MKDIVNIYQLSPMQQGMLFHSLYDRENNDSRTYLVQFQLEIEGNLDITILEQAWNMLMERHDVFRTRFLVENVRKPLQAVYRQVPLSLERYDWTGKSEKAQQKSLEEFLESDLARGLDFKKVPLMRVSLIKQHETKYNMIWTCHHLLLDGWSLSLIQNELLELYQALVHKRDPQLHAVRPYRDYISWIQKQDRQVAESFWREELKGVTAPTQMGTGLQREKDSTGYYEYTWEIPEGKTSLIVEMARRNQTTLNTVLQGAWAYLLSRYSGEEDVIFGVTSSGRPEDLAGADHMIGLFINTLPLRVKVPQGVPVDQWLQDLQKKQMALREYEYCSLVDIHGWSEVPRDTPLFETLFVFENYPDNDGGVETDILFNTVGAKEKTNYPLTLCVSPEERLVLKILYQGQSFDEASVKRIAAHFTQALLQIAQYPEQDVSQVSLITEEERHQLLIEWNQTEKAYSKDRSVRELFEEQATKNPDALAVVYGEERLTYKDLNQRANQLAHYLLSQGVKREDKLGLYVERSPEMIVGMLGILKAGGAYVPLDPAYPMERLQHIVEDAGIQLLLTQERLLPKLGERVTTTFCLDTDQEALAEMSVDNPIEVTGPDSLVYVIYTSGSTGLPKGVEVEQGALLNLIQWHQRTYEVTADSRATQIAGVSFDASVWEIWPYLTQGATLYLPEEAIRSVPEKLRDWLVESEVTVSFVPTPLAERLLALDWPEETRLRYLLTGGDRLHHYPSKEIPFALVNHYGPTENTVVTTAGIVPAESEQTIAPVIGRPIDNVQLYVLDEQRELVPIGVPGELYIGGSSLARGYSNSDLTGEGFVPNPFSTQPDARIYKTGDRVRYLLDGNLEFLGRIDHQVKIRGFRIELGEVEAVLSGYSGLQAAAVVVREDEKGDQRLVAYVVPAKDETIQITELRDYVKQKLPDYMVPSSWVEMDSFPLSPNGKVDLKALPAPDWKQQVLGGEYVAPRTPIEEMLTEIWADVLGVDRVGIYDNFFDLGGHSLLATQVASRVRKSLQVELPLQLLFQTPVIVELARELQSRMGKGGSSNQKPIALATRNRPLSLSFAQQRLWFFHQLHPENASYNMPALWRFQGRLNVEVLKKCFHEIVSRHESLRTTFSSVEDHPVQIIHPTVDVPLPVVEVEGTEKAFEWVRSEINRPFDLIQGPLFRTALIRLEKEDHLLFVNMHHIVSDGWSMGVFAQELSALYEAYIQDESSPLPALPIQYGDFAIWQREWMQGEILGEQLGYWKNQLAGVPVLQLPIDHSRPTVQTFRGKVRSFQLSPFLAESLRKLSRQEGTTLYMTLLSAFKVLLHRYTQQEDIPVGTPIANRNRTEIEGLIGFFVNTLVLRTDLSEEPSFRELLQRVKKVALEAYAHQDLPFEKLVEELQPERDLSHTPLFQVFFTMQNMLEDQLHLAGLKMKPVEMDLDTALFDLSLVIEEGDGIRGDLVYNADLFEDLTIERMVENLQVLLEAIVAQPDQKIGLLPILTAEERHQLLVEWNKTEREYPQDRTVHELFAEQAAKNPDALAVVCGEESITYRELNQQANQLAHYLRSQGVRPGSGVGLCVERSIDMMVGMLGIFKSGGCYVPLDPTYPEERLAMISEDAEVTLLLTKRGYAEKVSTQAKTIVLDGEWAEIAAGYSTDNPAGNVSLEDLAYIIFTSGSTGRPKGIQVNHKGLVNLVFWFHNRYQVTMTDRVTQSARMGFDASMLEVWPPLCAGASLHIVEQEVLMTPVELQEWLVAKGITLSHLPPVIAEELLYMDWPEETALRTLLTGSDRLQLQPPSTLPFDYVNHYGPTEYTVICSSGAVIPQSDENVAPHIGRPLINTELYVLDRHLNPVPVGVAGELHVGGDGLARGYLNRPDLTAQQFIPHPFKEGKRLYKTGDLVRYRVDGNLEFLGRIDHQVKIRGFRIELGEIEAVITGHASVQAAIAVVREDAPGGKRLVAYVVPAGTDPLQVPELREYVKQKLPDYMVPAAWVELDRLPLSPNGKVDRKALPVPDWTQGELNKEYVAPRNPVEEKLAAVWSEVLGVERIGIYDNFFDLGGHSLLATQVVSRLKANYQLELSLYDIFNFPTIEGLSPMVENSQKAPEPAIKRVSRERYRV